MIKGIIFDMDGVIVDSHDIYYENWNGLFEKKFHVTIPKKDFASHLGESAKHFTEVFLNKNNIKADPEKLLKEIMENHNKLKYKVTLKPGAVETLTRLKKNYKIALATGALKEMALDYLTRLNIKEYFDFIIAGDEVKRAKPEPEIFIKAAHGLKLKPEECIVVEDAKLGLLAAKKANMYAISIQDPYTKHQDHSMADLQLNKISELNHDIIRRIENGY